MPLCCVRTAIKRQEDRVSQSVIGRGQAGNCFHSVCDNTEIDCDKLVKITNLLPSTYTGVHIKQKFTLFIYQAEPHTFETEMQKLLHE